MKVRERLRLLWRDPAWRFDFELVCAVSAAVALIVGHVIA